MTVRAILSASVLVIGLYGLLVHANVQAQTTVSEKCSKDGPSDYYFVPAERYANRLYLIKNMRPGVTIDDRYTSKQVRINLRPINTPLSIPSNFMQAVHRRCALPYAKTYWDLVFVEALLPRFVPRTHENESLFSEGASLDRITIRIGSLAAERAHTRLDRDVKLGRLVLVSDQGRNELKEYRDPKRASEPLRPSYLQADPHAQKTPNGNPIVYWCYGVGLEKSIDEHRCQLDFVVPAAQWSASQKALFGDVQGLQVEYWFHRKHIASWHLIHERVIQMADEYLLDVSFAPPNPSPQRTPASGRR